MRPEGPCQQLRCCRCSRGNYFTFPQSRPRPARLHSAMRRPAVKVGNPNHPPTTPRRKKAHQGEDRGMCTFLRGLSPPYCWLRIDLSLSFQRHQSGKIADLCLPEEGQHRWRHPLVTKEQAYSGGPGVFPPVGPSGAPPRLSALCCIGLAPNEESVAGLVLVSLTPPTPVGRVVVEGVCMALVDTKTTNLIRHTPGLRGL